MEDVEVEVEVEVEEEEIPPAGSLSPNQDDRPPRKLFPRGPGDPAGRRPTLEKNPRRTKRKARGNRKLTEGGEITGTKLLTVRGKSWETLKAAPGPAWRNVWRNVRENTEPECLPPASKPAGNVVRHCISKFSYSDFSLLRYNFLQSFYMF